MKRFFLTIAIPCLLVVPAHAADSVDAVWIQRNVDFTFLGLETAYSCDFMKGAIEMLLQHVGAKDVEVVVPSCGGFKAPERQLRVLATYSTLAPAGAGDADVVKAAWSEVELGRWHPRSIEDRDCELLEQFQKYLLPTIEHEVIEGTTGCGAAKHSILGTLKLRVLKPVASDNAAATSEE